MWENLVFSPKASFYCSVVNVIFAAVVFVLTNGSN